MSLELVTTPPESANSYVSLEEAKQILQAMPDSQTAAWFANTMTDTKRAKLVATATRLIDEAFTFVGRRSTNDQILQWPRSQVSIDGLWHSGGYSDYLSDTRVPLFIKTATSDLARHLATTDIMEDNSTDSLESVSLSGISIKFNSSQKNSQFPASVLSTLRKWGTYQGSVGKEEAPQATSIRLSR